MSGSGALLVERYRLEERLSGPDPVRGSLWRAVDVMAGDLPVAIRQLETTVAQERLQGIWPQLQSLLHPQLPRCGERLELDGALWLVRDWQEGVGYDVLQQQRADRQMLFGADEVLLLLRQTLPVLAVLHGRGLVHGDVNPRNLLRRKSDGLPVLLDFGLVQREGAEPPEGASPGYGPRGQGRREPSAAWLDLHGLGVTALVLLSGQTPEALSGSNGELWCWPEGLDLEADFRQVLERLLSEAPDHRFSDATDVLKALQSVSLPLSVSMSAPEPSGAVSGLEVRSESRSEPTLVPRTSRAMAREQGAEGRLWPVVIALALSALVGSAIGWLLLSRTSPSANAPSLGRGGLGRQPVVSLPPAEVDLRQQLLSRLRALQVDRTWFLKLVDASLLSRFPERGGSLPSDSTEDAPLRQVWMELAEEWLARIEQLPPRIRARLGRLQEADWEQPREGLVQQGVHPRVVEHLVSAGAQDLLQGDVQGRKPPEPFRQLWFAAAMQSLDDVEIESVEARPDIPTNRSLRIPAGGARLVLVQVPAGDALALGINGTPLMQMMVFGADGQVVEERGPLRVARIAAEAGPLLQVLITNEGVSSGVFTLSCRADRPRPALPAVDPDPLPDSATGELVMPPGLDPISQ